MVSKNKYIKGGESMPYFNYHAKAQNLIKSGHLIRFEFADKWNSIAPALVLYFDNNKPMPIRAHKFDEYMQLINSIEKQSGNWYNFKLLYQYHYMLAAASFGGSVLCTLKIQ